MVVDCKFRVHHRITIKVIFQVKFKNQGHFYSEMKVILKIPILPGEDPNKQGLVLPYMYRIRKQIILMLVKVGCKICV